MYEIYRTSLIGRALVETIDSQIENKRITPAQAQFILARFDESIAGVFGGMATSNVNFKGNILSYNFVDGVWKFVAKDFVMSINNKHFRAPHIKIVACDDPETNPDIGRRKTRRNIGTRNLL